MGYEKFYKRVVNTLLQLLIASSSYGVFATEVEPNDITPQVIDLGETIVGQLSSSEDVDKFSFSVIATGTVTIAFTSDERLSRGWDVQLFDASNNLLSSTECSNLACQNGISVPVGVGSAGSYIVNIKRNNTSYSAPSELYRMSVEYSAEIKGAEFEPNDVTPQVIDLGETIVGQLSSSEDVDKFSFSVIATGTVTIAFTSDERLSRGWDVQLFDASNNLLSSTECSNLACQNGISVPVGVGSAGSYIVNIKRNNTSYSAPSELYRMSVEYSAEIKGAEFEPNDVTPQVIDLGETIVGQLSSSEDVDKFSFSVRATGTVTIAFTSDERLSRGWDVQLFDASNNLLSSTECSDLACQNGISVPVGVSSAGIYIVNIKRNNTSYSAPNELYRMSVMQTSAVFESSTITISDGFFDGMSGLTSVTIPNSVTRIGEYAFRGTGLTSLVIPDSVTSIGNKSFYNAPITSLKIGNSLQEWNTDGDNSVFYNICNTLTSLEVNAPIISDSAFSGCSKLTSLTLGNTVNEIKNYAFAGVASLPSLTIPNYVTSIGSSAFYGASSITELVIPDSVTILGGSAFRGASSLETVTLSNGITGISDYLFRDATKITSITIPSSVTSIGFEAFRGTGLTSLVIPDSVMSISNKAFYNAPISSLTLGKSLEAWNTTGDNGAFYNICTTLTSLDINTSSIPSNAFSGCSKLTALILGNTVTDIEFNAFNGASALKSFTVPSSVISIGNGAFYGASSITELVIPDSVTTLGSYAFYRASALESVILGDGIVNIAGALFYGASRLTSITIPSSVTRIGGSAFSGTGLTSLVIPDSVETIGNEAFYNTPITSLTLGKSLNEWITNGNGGNGTFYPICTTLTSLDINTRVIPNSAFSNCSKLAYLRLGDTVTVIGDNAISGASPLTSLTIPSSVTSIGSGAFYGASSITELVIPDSVTTLGGSAFRGASSLEAVTLGSGITKINDYLFRDATKITSITIPSSVTSIGFEAFRGTGLTSLVIPDSVMSISNKAFYNAPISSLTLGKSLEAWNTTGDNGAFYNICTTLTSLDINTSSIPSSAFSGCSKLASLMLGDKVTEIGNNSFSGASVLTSITIPSSVTSIGSGAFYGASSITELVIPDSVTTLGGSAFRGASSLEAVTLGSGITKINDYLFRDATKITSITIPSSVTSIGFEAFRGTGLTSLVIPDSVMSISNKAFYNAPISSLTLGKSLEAWNTTGDNGAFYNICTTLTSLDINTSSIPSSAFSGCSKLASLMLGDKVTEIGNNSFSGASVLTSITIPSSVTSIGSGAFYGASSITELVIPDSVTTLGGSAFRGASSLEAVTLGSGITKINDYLFRDATKITSITIPSSVTSIGFEAFRGTGLTSLVIPDSVMSISNKAFYNAPISSLTLGKSLEAWNTTGDNGAFYNICTTLTSLDINTSSIPSSAFSGCSKLASLMLGDKVTEIGDSTFYGTTSLESLIVPASITDIGAYAFAYSQISTLYLANGLTDIGDGAFRGTPLIAAIIPVSIVTIGFNAFDFNGMVAILVESLDGDMPEIYSSSFGANTEALFCLDINTDGDYYPDCIDDDDDNDGVARRSD